jgi:hypothetical protein
MATRRQHFVEFISPGTFFNETSVRPIETQDIAKAVAMSREIHERYDARPYAFQFFTSIVSDPIKDDEGGELQVQSREITRSGRHYIGGEVVTYDDVKARNDPKNRILLSNMEGNGWWAMIENKTGWLVTQPFEPIDVLVDPATAKIVRRGDEKALVKYRAEKQKAHEAEMAQWRIDHGVRV